MKLYQKILHNTKDTVGMSADALSALSGISIDKLRSIRDGADITLSQLEKLSLELDIPVSDLISEADLPTGHINIEGPVTINIFPEKKKHLYSMRDVLSKQVKPKYPKK